MFQPASAPVLLERYRQNECALAIATWQARAAVVRVPLPSAETAAQENPPPDEDLVPMPASDVPHLSLPETRTAAQPVATPPAHGQQGQMDGLTGLRAIAAFWVIAFHYGQGQFRPLHVTEHFPAVLFGYLGVDLFFMLSGFVIWHVHGADFRAPNWPKFKRFMLLRIARLYPVYLVTLLLMAAIYLLSTVVDGWTLRPAYYRPWDFVINLFLVQNWVTGRSGWNYPAWSVSAEWFCYFLFPLAALCLVRLGRGRALLALAALLASLASVYVFVFHASMNQSVGWPSLLRAMVEFVIGCLLRQVAGHEAMARVAWTPICLLLLAGAGVAVAVGSAIGGLLPILLFPVLILAASRTETLIGRLASWKPFVAVGAASYSLYLMQAPVQKALKWLEPSISPQAPLRTALIVAAYLGVLTLSTLLLYRCVEQPARRFLRKRLAPAGSGPSARTLSAAQRLPLDKNLSLPPGYAQRNG